MQREVFFQQLWADFIRIAPHAAEIRARFEEAGEHVENDHVAFRTFALPPINLEALEPEILSLGYELLDEYRFVEKRLRARAYVCEGAPRIFLSELLVDELSPWAAKMINELVAGIDQPDHGPGIFMSGRLWSPPDFSMYERLAGESEYAAWLAALGLRPNHFTVSVNALRGFSGVEEVLSFVEAAGYRINAAGGRVKGSSATLLEQGSTLADQVPVEFAGGVKHTVPTCYYEFALRHRDANGRLYDGFVPASADRIFESTHRS